MKKLVLLSLSIILIANIAAAQQRTVEKSFLTKDDQKISLNLKFGERITIKAWDKDEVSFKADIEINHGKLNDALELDFKEERGSLNIIADYNKEKIKKGKSTDCPNDNHSTYSWNDSNDNYMVCSNITYQLFVPANSNITVESISSDIELVNIHGPVEAKSISGFVDLSWPSGKPVTIKMKTISGDAFSDIKNLQLSNKKDHTPMVGYEIKGNIGSDGPAVSLESISGNIYLREGKG